MEHTTSNFTETKAIETDFNEIRTSKIGAIEIRATEIGATDPKTNDSVETKDKNFKESGDPDKFETELYSYYCKICNYHCFVCDTPLDKLPNRKNDKSKVILKNMFVRGYTLIGRTVYIRRKDGIEPQTRLKCKGCNVSVGYWSNHVKSESGNITSLDQVFGKHHIYLFHEVLT